MRMLSKPTSPFILIEDFISKLQAESLAMDLFDIAPNTDEFGNFEPMIRTDPTTDKLMDQLLAPLKPVIEQHYNIKIKGTERPQLEWIPMGTRLDVSCENSEYNGKKWVRNKMNDFTVVVFLSDKLPSGEMPDDLEVEHLGGSLEFPNHNFNISPKAGTVVIFPSGPHFLNATEFVSAGNVKQLRFHIVGEQPYFYMPEMFPGDMNSWF